MENYKIAAFQGAQPEASLDTAYDYLMAADGSIDQALIDYRTEKGLPL